jgi:hypothetical protein
VLFTQPIASNDAQGTTFDWGLQGQASLKPVSKRLHITWREGRLARLHEELKILDVFDRLHDYGADDPNRGDHDACVFRQKRRSEISAEIAKLAGRKPWSGGLRAGSAALLLCASLYATFHYLFS